MRPADRVVLSRIETRLGSMVAGATERELVLLEFADRPMLPTQLRRIETRFMCTCMEGESPMFDVLRLQLDQYFNSERQQFDVPLRAPGTPFQERVWTELRAIPCGATRSYADIASAIGQRTAVRAVARANGDNRIAVLIPCHRVIGSDGTLTGYGGGLWRKRRLLDLEAGAPSLFRDLIVADEANSSAQP
jgi:AraC family transcriptional regulator of adaptative response/methylated-DNA-[protein]-cysteine methyltransferase